MSEPVTLRAYWSYPPPGPGQYLRSKRGRHAYEIVRVTRGRRRPLGGWSGSFECRRLPPSEIPEGATVHQWFWDARGRHSRRALPTPNG